MSDSSLAGSISARRLERRQSRADRRLTEQLSARALEGPPAAPAQLTPTETVKAAEAVPPAPLPDALPPAPIQNAVIDDQMHRALTSLDDRLIEALELADIRFVRAAWLLSRPSGYRMVRRQDLEALEASGASPSPLLSPQEAAALVRKGTRSAGALTYGWPLASNPDPTGERVEVMKRALEQNPHIEGFFWEYAFAHRPRPLCAHSRQTRELLSSTSPPRVSTCAVFRRCSNPPDPLSRRRPFAVR